MSAGPITILGLLKRANGSAEYVTITGYATRDDLTIGGGPIIPPESPTHPVEPGTPESPTHPITPPPGPEQQR